LAAVTATPSSAAWLSDEQATQALRLPTTQLLRHPIARQLLEDAGIEPRKAGRFSVEWPAPRLRAKAVQLRAEIVSAVARNGVQIPGGELAIG
tara:strand:+ start:654 stop:932 length:279 start_codon:yes stop_codon:yes gene_type:complete